MNRSILELYNHISVQQDKTDMGFKALVEGVHDNLFVFLIMAEELLKRAGEKRRKERMNPYIKQYETGLL